MNDLNTVNQGLIKDSLKKEVQNTNINLSCGYAGCGSADSWPLSMY